MKFYRITTCDYVNDLSGEGAYMHGGRWNSKGTRILYTAESMALSMLEALAHITMVHQKRAYCRVVLEGGNGLVPEVSAVRETRTTATSGTGEIRTRNTAIGDLLEAGMVRHPPGSREEGSADEKYEWYKEITEHQLPTDWRNNPGPDVLKKFGDDFITEGKLFALKVPSVLTPDSFNYLLNPGHEFFKHLNVGSVEEVSFDYRLVSKK